MDERSELRRLQSELQTTKDNAEATRQYHLTTVTHLEDKLKVSFAAQIAIENHESNGPSASGPHSAEVTLLSDQLLKTTGC